MVIYHGLGAESEKKTRTGTCFFTVLAFMSGFIFVCFRSFFVFLLREGYKVDLANREKGVAPPEGEGGREGRRGILMSCMT